MAPPNLSAENIARTLAILGTTAALAACTKSEPAGVKADQAPTANASASAAAEPPPPPQVVAPPGAGPQGNDEGRAPEATATAAASAAPPVGGHAIELKKRKASPTGQASCGAGTCSADMKKK